VKDQGSHYDDLRRRHQVKEAIMLIFAIVIKIFLLLYSLFLFVFKVSRVFTLW